MGKEEKLIVEEAPPDTSTYFEGKSVVEKESKDAQGIEQFPFVEAIKEAG